MKNYLSILFISINKGGFIKNEKIIAECMKSTKPILVPTQTDNSKVLYQNIIDNKRFKFLE